MEKIGEQSKYICVVIDTETSGTNFYKDVIL